MFENHSYKKAFFLHFEWIMLSIGLILMALLDPMSQAASFCPVHRLGLDFCPGCGLGTSIAYTFQGEFKASLQAHPAGIFAVLVILSRIAAIFHRNYTINKSKKR